jgi:hypothetical protein
LQSLDEAEDALALGSATKLSQTTAEADLGAALHVVPPDVAMVAL